MRGPSAVIILAALYALAGCRPLYIPLVPDAPPAPTAVRLAADSHLAVVAGRPSLVLSLTATGTAAQVQDGAWLDVQWFGPSGRQAASESLWLDGERSGEDFTVELPADVVVVPGEWRAVVSMDGVVLRQFRVDVTADPEV